MRTSDHEALLHDVLAESTPDTFRAAVLQDTLEVLRRHKQRRRATRALGAVAGVLLLAIAGGRFWRAPRSQPPACEIVRTVPLPTAAIIRTQPHRSVDVGAFSRIALVHTAAPGSTFRLLNDRELLALAGSGRAALVRTGPSTQRLVVLGDAP